MLPTARPRREPDSRSWAAASRTLRLKYLCERANGGDFLILRANTEDEYAQKSE